MVTDKSVIQAIVGERVEEADFKRYAIPEFARIEIPLRDRYALADIADDLKELALRLRSLQSDHRRGTVEVMGAALMEIRSINRQVKQRRLASRLTTISGRSD